MAVDSLDGMIWCCRRRGADPLLQDPAEQDLHALGSVMRGFDQHQLARVLPSTLATYKRHTEKFYLWYRRQQRRWRTSTELDWLLVEWKNDPQEKVSKAAFANALACVELLVPWARGSLQWSHSVASGWAVSSPIAHTLPEPWQMTLVLAAAWARSGFRRVAALRLLQRRRGYRPQEALGLRRRDLLLPNSADHNLDAHIRATTVVHLGARRGTKAKRPEADVILPHQTLDADLVRWLAGNLEPNDAVVGAYNYEKYRRHGEIFCSLMRLLAYKPHGPRAGKASQQYLEGVSAADIQLQLRHNDLRSLKTYLDVVSVMQNLTEGDCKKWQAPARFIEENLWRMLNGHQRIWSELDAISPLQIPSRVGRARGPTH